MNENIVFVSAKRTPFGKFGGTLSPLSATELAVHAASAAFRESPVEPSDIDHVLFGNVLQTSADAAYLARHVGLKTGVAENVPAVTVNRLCGSGFESIVQGARLIQCQESRVVLVGGSENMSQAPYVLRKARFGYRLGNGELEDSLMSGLFDTFAKVPMAITAETLAKENEISRDDCDKFALLSQQRAHRAATDGTLAKEIAPIQVGEGKRAISLDHDEHIRPEVDLAGLGKLKPVFDPQGVVTAGNASGMVDGAAALIMTTESYAKEKGWPILGYYGGSSVVGCDPKRMGIGPVPAIRLLLEKSQLKDSDIERYEINEAFAPQLLAVTKQLGISTDRVNLHGGAIAIGHPLGATGARLVAHLLYQTPAGKNSIASACIGGGQGLAVLIRR